MCQSRHRQARFNVDALALSQPPIESYHRPLQQGRMLLVEPSYLSYLAPMKAVVARGPLQVHTFLPEALL
jgi:hypothetical protein